jgi:hypothetical protein
MPIQTAYTHAHLQAHIPTPTPSCTHTRRRTNAHGGGDLELFHHRVGNLLDLGTRRLAALGAPADLGRLGLVLDVHAHAALLSQQVFTALSFYREIQVLDYKKGSFTESCLDGLVGQ